MADIPLIPDRKNIDTFRDFINLQKAMNDVLMAQKTLYYDIGRFNASVEARVVARLGKERRLLGINERLAIFLQRQKLAAVGLEGAAAEHAARRIKSIENRMAMNGKEMQMMREANQAEMEIAKKTYEDKMKWFNFAGKQAGEMFDIKVKEVGMTKNLGDELMKLGVKSEKVAYSWAAILTMLKGGYELFKKFDKAAWDFRKAMGFTRTDAKEIRVTAERMAIDFMHIGVTIDGIYDSWRALREQMGSGLLVTKDLLQTTSIMKAQLGISEEITAGFMRNMAAISKTTMQAQSDSVYMAASLAQAAQVPLADVMKDVASKSTTTLTMISRLPNVVLRTSIELRRMGTSLSEAAKSSRHILDFNESINEEMEASVLLGRSINLQRARELAYRRDIEGSTKEILRIAKNIGFEDKDTYQQEAFARATGKSVDELLRMIQADKQWAAARRSNDPKVRALLETYERMRRENEAAAKANGKSLEIMLRQKANQERLAAISMKWNQIMAQAQSVLLPILDILLSAVIPAMDIAKGLMAWSAVLEGLPTLFSFLAGKFKIIASLGTVFAKIGTWLAPVTTWVGKTFPFITKLFGFIGKIFGVVGKFTGVLAFFGKWIPIIGWVIMGLQFIYHLFKRWRDIWNDPNMNIGQKIWAGLKAVVGALYDVLIQPFVDAFKWIMSWFGGKSPSKIGLAIVKGIWGVQMMMYKVLLYPFQMAYSAILTATKWVAKMAWKAIVGYFSMWEHLGRLVYDGAKYLGTRIVDGLRASKEAVVDAVTSPFTWAWGNVKKLWGGHSPSEVGLSIVKGLSSVNTGVFAALISPFKLAYGWIMDKFSGIKDFFAQLFKGSVEKKAMTAYIPAVTVTPQGTTIAGAKEKPAAPQTEKEATLPMTEATGQKMVALLEKILAKDSSIKMDGQMLGVHLARQTEFRGGYGVNKVA